MSLDPWRARKRLRAAKELARESGRRTQLTFSERLKLQLETLKTGAKT